MTEPTAETEPRPRSRRRRVLLGLLALWLVLFAAAVGLASWTVATETGARWALGRFLPEDLTVERVEGRFAGPLVLHGLESRSDGADLRVELLRLEWRPSRLWRRTLQIDTLELEGVAVRQKPTEPVEPEPFDLDDIDLPFGVRVQLDHLRLADVRIWAVQADEPTIVDEVVASATAAGSEIRLTSLQVRAPAYRLGARGDIVTRERFPLSLELAWRAELPEQPPLAGSGRLRGDLLGELVLDHDLHEPTPARLAARVHDPLRELRWCAEVRVPRFALGTVVTDLDAYQAGVEFSACGDAESMTGRGDFAAVAEELGEVSGALRLAFADGRLRLDDLAVRLPGAGRVTARGEVYVAGGTPEFRLRGEWADLGWPLQGTPDYASPRGRFEVAGTQERYRLAVDAAVAGSGAPAGRWRVDARGTPTELFLESVLGTTLDGRVTGRGSVAWGSDLTWTLTAAADRLDPGAFLPDLPGLIGLDVTTRGSMRDGRLRADVRLGRLDGVLLGTAFDLRSDISLDGDRYTVRSLELVSGSASVRASGHVGSTWDLGWEADAPDLAGFEALAPDLRGSLSARGTLTGPRERPLVAAGLVADSVRLGENAVEQTTAMLSLDLSDREPSHLQVRLAGVQAGAVQLDSVRLGGGGGHLDHALTLTAFAPADSLAVTVSGGVANGAWSGTLDRLDLRTAQFGAWALRAPAPIRASADSARLDGLCWGRGDAEACLDGAWAAAVGGHGMIDVRRVPLGLLQPFLPEDATLDGELNLAGHAAADTEGMMRAEARLVAGPGALRFGPAGEGQPHRAFEALVADLALDDLRMRADFALRLSDGDSIAGFIDVPQGVPAEEQVITGRVAGEVHDRGLLGLLVDDVVDSEGVLRIDLVPGGTLAAPRLAGEVVLENGRAAVLPAGLRLREIAFRAASDGDPEWTLTGALASGPGRAELEGSLRLPEAAAGPEPAPWRAELAVRGERFEAFNTPLAHVVASPDLRIAAGPGRIDLTGEVGVPRARITPAELEAVVPTSEDVVLVGANGEEPAEPEPVVAVHTRVRVQFGDSVHMDAFGLRGRLTGGLTVIDEPGAVTTGRGEIQIRDGTFQRFRQRLEIDRGRLIFADGPIDNPGLDVRITRRTGDVLAGMNVAGTAVAPRIEFFSDPGMAEADVLAYLALGRPASLASQAEGEFLQNAAASAGLAGGRMLAGRLGSTLGLQDARIEGEDLEQASLFLGTYLSPRLYVGYGIGLFEAANLLRIRYQLGRSWVLQTESGLETGADLMYTIER